MQQAKEKTPGISVVPERISESIRKTILYIQAICNTFEMFGEVGGRFFSWKFRYPYWCKNTNKNSELLYF